ncbi:MAG: hypothetical protein IJB32_00150 [Clostridia bacterium]|nr:hypothetical protein [Clostridia bacterium]
MKKVLSIIMIACFSVVMMMGLTACSSNNNLQKLSAPIVTLNGNVALWSADQNADKFEISLSGELSYVENTVTSKTLTNGQTFKVRAVGDGKAFATSDWSNLVTYMDGESQNPTTLSTPSVTVSSTGLASWAEVLNASGYAYKINGGAEVPTNSTSVQLSLNQSIVVKAVGDQINYSDSGWSVARYYTDGSTAIEPQYLGIFASKNQPQQSSGLPEQLVSSPVANTFSLFSARMNEYRSFKDLLEEWFTKEENHLGETYPKQSDYDIYSSAGNQIYVQIWLNNPTQCTILSLKLNGTKYQVGGGLFSFFIEKDGVHYNCVYVAVTIPENTYVEKDYVVSDIEYVEGAFINADGTDTFMNENNTIKVGLPYNALNPIVSNYIEQSVSVNSYSATFDFEDAFNMSSLSGGWVGVAVYDGYENYKILQNKKVNNGSNTLNVTGLKENAQYTVMVYVYADLHDGQGVCPHSIYYDWIFTPSVLMVNEVSGINVLNNDQSGYVGAVNVDVELKSATAEFIKLEILKDEQVIYTDNNFTGQAVVTDGILNKTDYQVRVYYKDVEYLEGKYHEEHVYVNALNDPRITDEGAYTFVNHAIYNFSFTNQEENNAAVKDFVVRIYDDKTANYIAEGVLVLIEKPNIIDTLRGEWSALREDLSGCEEGTEEFLGISDEMKRIHDRIMELETVRTTWNDKFEGSQDQAFWEAEKQKGKYLYEYSYAGENTEYIKKVDNVYYVILENVDAETYDYKMQIFANLDKNESEKNNGLVEKVYYVNNNLLRFNKLFETDVHIGIKEDAELVGNQLSLSLYNSHDPRIGDYGETSSDENLRYVYRIEANGIEIYLNETAIAPTIDESAWIEEYLSNASAGTLDAVELYKKYISNYTSQTLVLDYTNIDAGKYTFLITTRMYNKTYEVGESDGWVELRDMEIYKQFETPSIRFEGVYGYVTTSQFVDKNCIVFEAYDKDANPIIIDNYCIDYYSDNTYRFEFCYEGAKARVKLSKGSNSGEDGGYSEPIYWIDSEWTAYATSTAIALETPTFNVPTFNYGDYELTWSSTSSTDYIRCYKYIIGSAEEREGDSYNLSYVHSSCVIKVKVVASEWAKEAGYCDSEWATYNYTYQQSKPEK